MNIKHYSQNICTINFHSSFCNNGFENTHLEEWSLNGLKQINFFIGRNNSGKSRIIRAMYKTDMYEIDSNNFNSRHYRKAVYNNIYKLNKVDYYSGLMFESIDENNANKILNDIKHSVRNKLRSVPSSSLSSAFNEIIQKSISKYNNGICTTTSLDSTYILLSPDSDMAHFFHAFNPTEVFFKTYIPTLRGLRPLLSHEEIELVNEFHRDNETPKNKDSGELKLYFDDLNIARTLADYDIPDDKYIVTQPNNTIEKKFKNYNHRVFTGFSLYEDLTDLLLSGHEGRNIVTNYEVALSEHFFDNDKITLTPKKGEDVVYIKIGEQDERPIYNVGDGLQTILIITFPVFTAKKSTQFYIEEPETHLHAGQQRSLIEALASKPEHMYFISTHSNHFIDLAQERNDISIQKVYQKSDGNSQLVTCVDSLAKDTEVLDDLGVRASSVLLANCSIWVEGVTDKLYLRAYMKKYIYELNSKDSESVDKLSSLKENLHYIFTEYQGSNITHWYFGDNEHTEDETTAAQKLCSKAFLLADGDIQSKGTRVKKLKDDLGDSFMLLDFKEIENYIPEDILKAATTELWDTFNLKEKATFDPVAILQNDYGNDTGIGRYLEGFVNNHPTERRFFADKSGTIKDKVKLCRISVRLMNENEDWELTPEITKICKRIYDHIVRSNHV